MMDEKTATHKRIWIILAAGSILVAALLAFLPSLDNGFTNWDDFAYVTECRAIRDLSFSGIKEIFTTFHLKLYKPLVMLSFAIEYRFFGLLPSVYHLTNVVFHLLNCLLVFRLILLLSHNTGTSFLTALLFAIHPMHVESVAWVAERKDVLYSFFFLIGLISYVYYYRTHSAKYRRIVPLALALSLMAKPMGITMPFLLFAFDYLEGREFNAGLVVEKIPVFIVSASFAGINAYAHFFSGSFGGSTTIVGFPDNIFNACYAVYFYIEKFFLPAGLSCIYPYPERGAVLSAVAMMFFFVPLVIISVRYTKKVAFGTVFFLICLSPVLQFFSTVRTLVADRYTYIAYIGLFYILSSGLVYLYEKRDMKFGGAVRAVIVAGVIAAAGILMPLTNKRTEVWKDSSTLWSDVLSKFPDTAMAYGSRGMAYVSMGYNDEAIADLNRAIALDPETYTSSRKFFGNRAFAYMSQGDFERAIPDYSMAIQLGPGDAKLYYSRGFSYDMQGSPDAALSDYDKAIELEPHHLWAYHNRGVIRGAKGETGKAIADFTKAIELDPSIPEPYLNRAKAYYSIGEYEKARRDIKSIKTLGGAMTQELHEILKNVQK